MVVIRAISKEDAIFRTWPKHKFVLVRKFLAVDGPVVEPVHSPGDLLENHVDHFRGCGWRSGAAKNRVVPDPIRWPQELRLPFLIFVLNDDAQARVAIGISSRTKSPYARPVHIHEAIHALARTHRDDVH